MVTLAAEVLFVDGTAFFLGVAPDQVYNRGVSCRVNN
jgi:hypothetical protein